MSSCNTTEPPIKDEPPAVVKYTITISVTQTTHRSITLKITSTFNKPAKSIELYRRRENKDTLVESYTAFTLEKEIIDDDSGKGFIIDTEYKYFAVRVDTTNKWIDTSEIITARTLPPTSHEYTWEEFIIGDDGNSNVLYDVWGTDENNVYAVGGVTINDTTYGIIHWDGTEWKPERKIGGLHSIYGFSENDIWAAGGTVVHFDGNKWNPIDAKLVNNQAVILDPVLFENREYTCIWGTSSDNLYLGNLRRNIVHWNGRFASVEDLPEDGIVFDIHGIDKNHIIAAGNDLYLPGFAFTKDQNSWKLIPELLFEHIDLESVYTRNSKEAYLCGSGIVDYFDGKSTLHSDITTQALNKIRGNKETADMFAVGYKEILHFNGIDWKSYRTELSIINESNFRSVFLVGKKVFIVGYRGSKGIIIIGTK